MSNGMGAASAHYVDFLRGLLNNPRAVSAPTPSGPVLAAAIAAQVDASRPGIIIELGAGTGVITAALLDRGFDGSRIVAIEQDSYFAAIVGRRFPTVRIICGDALRFEEHLPAGTAVAAVVSGLPLLNFPMAQRQSLLKKALDRQGAGGLFIQLSYSWRAPVPRGNTALGMTRIWRNLPPAHVWTYRNAHPIDH